MTKPSLQDRLCRAGLPALLDLARPRPAPDVPVGRGRSARRAGEMYDRGLQFLATTQTENGDWPGPAASKGRASPAWP